MTGDDTRELASRLQRRSRSVVAGAGLGTGVTGTGVTAGGFNPASTRAGLAALGLPGLSTVAMGAGGGGGGTGVGGGGGGRGSALRGYRNGEQLFWHYAEFDDAKRKGRGPGAV